MWAKRSLWERSTRVPLIISTPHGLKGVSCSRPVELLSIFPTLSELCKLPNPLNIDGLSITKLLEDPRSDWSHPAITTFREEIIPFVLKGIDILDMRTDQKNYMIIKPIIMSGIM